MPRLLKKDTYTLMEGSQQREAGTLFALGATTFEKNKGQIFFTSSRIFVWCNKVKGKAVSAKQKTFQASINSSLQFLIQKAVVFKLAWLASREGEN